VNKIKLKELSTHILKLGTKLSQNLKKKY